MEPSAKMQQPSKADRIRAITESIYKEERKVCSPQPVRETQGCVCRPPTTPEKTRMLQVAALNILDWDTGFQRPLDLWTLHQAKNSLRNEVDSSTINSVPTSVCLQRLSLIFKPLKIEQETLRIPHSETVNALHNKAVVTKRYFLHNSFTELSPLSLNNIRSYDPGFQQLRWSKNVYTEYQNNPCLSKQAKMKTSSSISIHPLRSA